MQIKAKCNYVYSVGVFVVYIFHFIILNAPLLGALNVLLLSLSYLFLRKVSFFRDKDPNKWAGNSLALLFAVAFSVSGLELAFKDFGHLLTEAQKLLGEALLFSILIAFCFYGKDVRGYFSGKLSLFLLLLIVISAAIVLFILKTYTEAHVVLFSNERLCSLTLPSSIALSLVWWGVLTFVAILINSFFKNNYVAVVMTMVLLQGGAAVPFSGWSLLPYFLLLGVVVRRKQNYLYAYLGGILLSVAELTFLC